MKSNSAPLDGGKPGQFRKDLVAMANPNGGVGNDSRLWVMRFDEVEVSKVEIASAVKNELFQNKHVAKAVLKDILNVEIDALDVDEVQKLVVDKLFPAVDAMFKGV